MAEYMENVKVTCGSETIAYPGLLVENGNIAKIYRWSKEEGRSEAVRSMHFTKKKDINGALSYFGVPKGCVIPETWMVIPAHACRGCS